MTPAEFIKKWKPVALTERAAAHTHFLDLCKLFEHEDPVSADPTGEWFTFEKGATKTGGGEGFADVWKKNFFAWEYKKKKRVPASPRKRPTSSPRSRCGCREEARRRRWRTLSINSCSVSLPIASSFCQKAFSKSSSNAPDKGRTRRRNISMHYSRRWSRAANSTSRTLLISTAACSTVAARSGLTTATSVS